MLLVSLLVGCAAPATPVPVPQATPSAPAPVPWENHTVDVSCEWVTVTDEFGHYGWWWSERTHVWVRDSAPTVEQALSSIRQPTDDELAGMVCP